MADDVSSAHEHNRRAWNARAARGERFTQPAPDDYLADPRGTLDSLGWLPAKLAGLRVLCLGSGGGRQSPLFAALGAQVTVVDLSGAMLAIDRQVAAERGLDVMTVETSMDELGMLAQASFDLVWQPVSTCYVPDVVAVYRAVARLQAPGGLYVSQHKQPGSLQASAEPGPSGYLLAEPYYRSGPLPDSPPCWHREAGTIEFLHRWEELLGGLCRAGYVVEDLVEPRHGDASAALGTFAHRSLFAPPYVRIKARRHGPEPRAAIWQPG